MTRKGSILSRTFRYTQIASQRSPNRASISPTRQCLRCYNEPVSSSVADRVPEEWLPTGLPVFPPKLVTGRGTRSSMAPPAAQIVTCSL